MLRPNPPGYARQQTTERIIHGLGTPSRGAKWANIAGGREAKCNMAHIGRFVLLYSFPQGKCNLLLGKAVLPPNSIDTRVPFIILLS